MSCEREGFGLRLRDEQAVEVVFVQVSHLVERKPAFNFASRSYKSRLHVQRRTGEHVGTFVDMLYWLVISLPPMV